MDADAANCLRDLTERFLIRCYPNDQNKKKGHQVTEWVEPALNAGHREPRPEMMHGIGGDRHVGAFAGLIGLAFADADTGEPFRVSLEILCEQPFDRSVGQFRRLMTALIEDEAKSRQAQQPSDYVIPIMANHANEAYLSEVPIWLSNQIGS